MQGGLSYLSILPAAAYDTISHDVLLLLNSCSDIDNSNILILGLCCSCSFVPSSTALPTTKDRRRPPPPPQQRCRSWYLFCSTAACACIDIDHCRCRFTLTLTRTPCDIDIDIDINIVIGRCQRTEYHLARVAGRPSTSMSRPQGRRGCIRVTRIGISDTPGLARCYIHV